MAGTTPASFVNVRRRRQREEPINALREGGDAADARHQRRYRRRRSRQRGRITVDLSSPIAFCHGAPKGRLHTWMTSLGRTRQRTPPTSPTRPTSTRFALLVGNEIFRQDELLNLTLRLVRGVWSGDFSSEESSFRAPHTFIVSRRAPRAPSAGGPRPLAAPHPAISPPKKSPPKFRSSTVREMAPCRHPRWGPRPDGGAAVAAIDRPENVHQQRNIRRRDAGTDDIDGPMSMDVKSGRGRPCMHTHYDGRELRWFFVYCPDGDYVGGDWSIRTLRPAVDVLTYIKNKGRRTAAAAAADAYPKKRRSRDDAGRGWASRRIERANFARTPAFFDGLHVGSVVMKLERQSTDHYECLVWRWSNNNEIAQSEAAGSINFYEWRSRTKETDWGMRGSHGLRDDTSDENIVGLWQEALTDYRLTLGMDRVGLGEIGPIVDEGAAEVVRFTGKWGNGGGHVMVGLTSRGATDATLLGRAPHFSRRKTPELTSASPSSRMRHGNRAGLEAPPRARGRPEWGGVRRRCINTVESGPPPPLINTTVLIAAAAATMERRRREARGRSARTRRRTQPPPPGLQVQDHSGMDSSDSSDSCATVSNHNETIISSPTPGALYKPSLKYNDFVNKLDSYNNNQLLLPTQFYKTLLAKAVLSSSNDDKTNVYKNMLQFHKDRDFEQKAFGWDGAQSGGSPSGPQSGGVGGQGAQGLVHWMSVMAEHMDPAMSHYMSWNQEDEEASQDAYANRPCLLPLPSIVFGCSFCIV
ncbi:hypothetical protein GEV33_014382 [Tenebrio molitor]|uniref:Uncharacterized protein n=1 Tax=Tenebrio molitor TaxID=7067 RepID=A0A8J6H545_TENMO|nr:hypothetical protein GEV33_014382 [Tenebrio molitor]